jgi:SAM-dependent methyltransferase
VTAGRTDQTDLDAANAAFWDELCGTWLARQLGIDVINDESLRRFDDAYMAMYPYLWRYLELDQVRGQRVLEIGLGFGTVGQLLACAGAEYYGVDVALGPIEMTRERLRMKGLDGSERIQQGNALNLPFESGTFDRVVTIGCLHHTGNAAQGVAEVHRVLAPGGRAVVMLYNAHSVRQFGLRARAMLDRRRDAEKWIGAHYDSNTAGDVLPHIEYTSRSAARRLFRSFDRVRIDTQNIHDLRTRWFVVRREQLLGNVARLVGSDLYIVVDKSAAR